MRPPEFEIRQGDALDVLRKLPDGMAQACVTSPPYYGLRDYGHDEQIGLERTVGEYVARLVEILGEAGRVLRDDGTLWLNLGDSYFPHNGTRGNVAPAPDRKNPGAFAHNHRGDPGQGLKAKDLIGVPWRVAFALQDAGWWLRKAIIWDKPNPIPEAVTDRPTSSHELVFLLTKAPTYFYDLDGHREPFADERQGRDGSKRPSERDRGGRSDGFTKPNGVDPSANGGRQARDVWRIPTVPFPGTHFAVFPPELPRRCIALGSSPRACERCTSPWVRILDRTRTFESNAALAGTPPEEVGASGKWGDNPDRNDIGGTLRAGPVVHTRTLGWRPSCGCGAPPGVEAGDLDVIASPLAPDVEREDASLLIGRAGFGRERNPGEGTRPITRYEQRHLARQLASSPHRDAMESEAGPDTFAHYLRTDRVGARPPRHDLLEAWRSRGWIADVQVPEAWWDENDASRCLVLDPFAGAGTTGMVAVAEGRDFLGIELNGDYAEMARERVAGAARTPAFEFLA